MTPARGTLLASVLVLLAGGGVPLPANSGQKALLIGVGAYPHLPLESQLLGPPNDARAMRAFLTAEWGFEAADIRSLIDEQATKQGILDALEHWLPEATAPGDRVVIYYSGHGSRVRDIDGDEEDGMDETFVPADYGRANGRDADMLLDDELGAALARLGDRRVLLIADSCHSGTVSRSMDRDEAPRYDDARPRYLPVRASSRQILVVRDEEPMAGDLAVHLTLSAALPHQLAWEVDGGGLFTKYLIEGLTDLRADLNGNGRLTSAELISFIKPRTETWCRDRPNCERHGFTPNLDPKQDAFLLQPPTLATDTEAVSDILPSLGDGAVSVAVEPGPRLHLGNKIEFRVTSTMAGYLTLLDLGPGGELVLLFPTAEDLRHGKTGRIRAGHPLHVPDPSYGFEWVAQPPTGAGQVLAIVTGDRIELDGLLDGHRDFEPITDQDAFMKSLAARLYAVWTGDSERNRAVAWAVGYSDYRISR